MEIKEYWNLIGREPFLAITWEPDFSQACSRMLINHKNICLTHIPDIANDMIFLKKSKNLVLRAFLTKSGHFYLIFSKKSGCDTKLHMTSNTMLSFRKKLMRQFWENLRTDGRSDRRMDWQILFYRTLLAEARSPIKSLTFQNFDVRREYLEYSKYQAHQSNKVYLPDRDPGRTVGLVPIELNI